MYKKILLSGLTLMLSAPSFAAVTLELTDNIDLILVNGEKPETEGSFFSSAKEVTLPDGENQIVFRHTATYQKGNERDEFNSDVIVAKFNTENTELKFQFPKYRDLKEAKKKFNEELNWQLLDNQDQPITYQQDKLIHHGMQLGRNYKDELLAYNVKGGVAAVELTGTAAAIGTAKHGSKSSTSKAASSTDSTAEEMLHFWYSKADAETKKRFKEYVNSN